MARIIKPIELLGQVGKGIAQHPLLGIAQMRNLDIQTNPGSIRLNNPLVKKSGSTVTGNVTGLTSDPVSGKIFGVDDTHRIYQSTDNGDTWTLIGDGTGTAGSGKANNTASTGGGMAVWKNYLFVLGSTSGSTGNIDVYGPIVGSPTWYNQWQTIDTSYTQIVVPMFTSVDNCLYIGNGKYTDKLQEATPSFAPATSASFTYTAKAITLADNYITSSIQDLGSQLMLTTQFLGTSPQLKADIFPYDRSTLTLGVPVKVVENGIRAAVTYAGRLYFVAGFLGKLYRTDGVNIEYLDKIPNYIINTDGGNSINVHFGAMIVHKSKIYFGVSTGGNIGGAGVWSYDPNSKALNFENTISTGDDGTANGCDIQSLLVVSQDQYIVGWQNNGYGIDKINNGARVTSYTGFIESFLVDIANYQEFGGIGYITFSLLKVLTSGQGVRIKWRKHLTDSWTTLVTWDYVSKPSTQGGKLLATSLRKLMTLQVRIELTSTDNTSPELFMALAIPHEYEGGY